MLMMSTKGYANTKNQEFPADACHMNLKVSYEPQQIAVAGILRQTRLLTPRQKPWTPSSTQMVLTVPSND